MEKLFEKKLSIIMILIQLLLSAGSVFLIAWIDFLPFAYIMTISVTAVFLLAYTIVSQITDKSMRIGRILSGLFSVLFVLFACYGFFTYEDRNGFAFQKPEGPVSFLVLSGNQAKTVGDLAEYRFGVLEDIEQTGEEIRTALEKANEICGTEVETVSFHDMDALIEGLYTEHVQVILFDETYRDSVMESHAMFEADTKIVTAGS